MKKQVVRDKSLAFGIRVMKACRHLRAERKEYEITNQLLRSGTAIGALVREATQAESTADFIHKLSIALKEADETEYWLQLLHENGYFNKAAFSSLHADNVELLKLLTSIIKSAKQSKNQR